MATAAAAKDAPTLNSRKYDRLFYSGMAVLFALTIFVGFAPTFYLRSLFGAPVSVTGSATLSPLAIVHGAVFTGWVLLFLVQTNLVARHRVALHRQLGMWGAYGGIVMFVLGSLLAIKAAARGSAPPGGDPLGFLTIPLGDMVMFAFYLAAAMWFRTDKEIHKRLMLLAYISIAAAGVARWPGVLPLGPFGFYGITSIFLFMGIVYDWVSRKRVHPAYLWGGGLFIASVPVRLMISGTAPWHSFAAFLVRTF